MGIYDGMSPDDLAAQRAALADVAARRPGTRAITDDDLDVDWSDYGRAALGGLANTAGQLAGGVEYATGFGGDARRALTDFGQDQIERTSPRYRRRMDSEFFAEEDGKGITEGDGLFANLAAKATVAAPSIVASIIPAGLVGVALRGAGASAATAGLAAGATAKGAESLLVGGDIAGQIATTIERTSDENLEKLSAPYRQYRAMGMSPEEARRRYIADVQGVLPVVGAAISYALPGVEPAVAGRLAGAEARGFLRGAGQGALREAGQEAVESGVGARFSNVDELDDITWRDILSQALEGAAVGGVLGGVTGGAAGIGSRETDRGGAVAEDAATSELTPEPGGPPPPDEGPSPGDPTTAAAPSPLEKVQAIVAKNKARNVALAEAKKRALKRGVTVVDAATPAPDIAVALAANEKPAAAPAPSPVPDVPQPVIPEVINAPTPQPVPGPAAIAPAAVPPVGVQPDVPGPGPVPAGGGAELQPAPAPVLDAPVVAPAPAPAAPPVTPREKVLGKTRAGQRILADTTAPVAPVAAPKVADDAEARAAQAVADEAAARGKTLSEEKLAAKVAKEVAKEQKAPTPQATARFGKAQADLVARGEQGFGFRPTEDKQGKKNFQKRLNMVVNALGDREPPNDMVRALKKASESGSWSDLRAAMRAVDADEVARAEKMEPIKKGHAAEQAKIVNKRKDRAQQLKEIYEKKRPSDLVTAKSADEIRAWVNEVDQAITKAKLDTGVQDRVSEESSPEDAFATTIRELARAFSGDKKSQPSTQWLNDFRANAFFYFAGEGQRIKEFRKADAEQRQKSLDAPQPSGDGKDTNEAALQALKSRTAKTGEGELEGDILAEVEGDERTDDEIVEQEDAPSGEVVDTTADEADTDLAPARDEPEDTPEVTQERAKIELPPDAFMAGKAKEIDKSKVAVKGKRQKLEVPGAPKVTGAVSLKSKIALKKTEPEEDAPVKRRVWPTTLAELAESKKPGYVSGYRKVVLLRLWVNSLSDAEYQRLAKVAPYNFPNAMADTWEPGRLLAAWQQSLAQNKTVYVDPGSDSDDRSRINYDPLLDEVEATLLGGATQMNPMQGWDNVEGGTDQDEFGDLASLLGNRHETIKNHKGIEVDVYDKRLVADDISRIADDVALPMLGRVNAARWEKAAKGLLKSVKIYSISPANMKKYYTGSLKTTPAGLYDPNNNVILIRADVALDPVKEAHIIVHEVVHAVTARELNSDPVLRQRVDELYETAMGWIPSKQYGLENRDEFLSEAFSNPEFQKILAGIPVDASLRRWAGLSVTNVWDAFKKLVMRALGFVGDDNLLNAVFDMGTAIEQSATKRAARRDLIKRVATSQAPMLASPGNYAKNAVVDAGASLASLPAWLRKKGLVLSTLDQIRQQAKGLFVDAGGDALDDMIKAMQRIEPRARAAEEAGHEIAQKFLDWAKGNPAEAVKLATLGTRATGLNMSIIPGVTPADVADAIAVIEKKKDAASVSAKAAELAKANKHLGKDAFRGWQGKADLAAAHAEFNALSPEAQALYTEMRDFYREVQKAIASAHIDSWFTSLKKQFSPQVTAQIKAAALAGNMKLSEKTAMGNDKLFDELRRLSAVVVTKGDYFPAMRYGEHVVIGTLKLPDPVGGTRIDDETVEFRGKSLAEAKRKAARYAKGLVASNGPVLSNGYPDPANQTKSSTDFGYRLRFQTKGAHFFEKRADAMKFIKENPEGYDKISQEPVAKSTAETMNDLSPMQVQTLMKSVNARLEGDENKDKRALFQKILKEAAVRSMAGSRIQSRTLVRREVRGASTEYGRNLVRYAHASSRHVARLNYMPVVSDAFVRMRKIHGLNEYGKGAEFRSEVMNEINSRLDTNLSGTAQSHPIIEDLKRLSFIDKLFSPAWSVINASQPWMVTLPHMAGRYGAYRVARELSVAYRDIMAHQAVGAGLKNTVQASVNFAKASIDATDPIGSIKANLAKSKDGRALVAMVDELIALGRIDPAAGFELASVTAEGQGAWGQFLTRTDRVARQLPSAIEQVNRTITAISAYRLARKSGLSAKAATDYAADVVSNTQGDYSVLNAPKFFNRPVLGAALQFKKYAQMMYALLGSALYKSFNGATPEVKKAARKELMLFFVMQIMAAGALGVPFSEVAKLMFMAAGALGFGGGYDDFERELRELAADTIGPYAGELLIKGVVPRAVGIDLSSRVGMDSMLTFGEPRKYETDQSLAWFAQTVGGAPFSLALDQFKAARAFADGEYGKGAELIPAPKFLTDLYKSTRGALYGRQSQTTGKETSAPLGVGEAVVNTLGFRTAGQAEESAKLGKQYALRGEVEKRSREMSKLKNQYVQASNSGEKTKIFAKIKALNEGLPAKDRVTPAKLSDFARNYKKDETKGAVVGPFRLRNKDEAAELRKVEQTYNSR